MNPKRLKAFSLFIAYAISGAIVANGAAWLLTRLTINGRCAVPTADIITDCAEQQLRADRWANGLTAILSLPITWAALAAVQTQHPRRKP